MPTAKKIAVVLFQLGGPDSQAAVEPFLYNLFCDPDIINFPGSFLARKPLAKLISITRSKVARAALCRDRRRFADPPPDRAAGARPGNRAASAHSGAHDRGHALLASGYRRGHRRARKRSVRRARAAAALSALFLRHHRQQPEGMEPSLQAQGSRSPHRSFLRSSRTTSPESSSASTACSSSCRTPRKFIWCSAPTACRWRWSKRAILTRSTSKRP